MQLVTIQKEVLYVPVTMVTMETELVAKVTILYILKVKMYKLFFDII